MLKIPTVQRDHLFGDTLHGPCAAEWCRFLADWYEAEDTAKSAKYRRRYENMQHVMPACLLDKNLEDEIRLFKKYVETQ